MRGRGGPSFSWTLLRLAIEGVLVVGVYLAGVQRGQQVQLEAHQQGLEAAFQGEAGAFHWRPFQGALSWASGAFTGP